jgi:hypothetical protein
MRISFREACWTRPRTSRAGSFGILYAIGVAIFGGFTQFMIKWLIEFTGSPLAPAWYLSVALTVGGGGMILLPESAPRLRRSA